MHGKNRFLGLNIQLVIQNKSNVVGKQLFARRLFTSRVKTTRFELELVRRRENRETDRVIVDRVPDQALFDDQVFKVVFLRFVRSGNSCRTGADDYEVK